MSLPLPVEAAKRRMDQAEAALRTDIESGKPYDSKRRKQLLGNLDRAMGEYLEKLTQLRP